ncbi:MAG: phosphoribosylamine--glycine ligase [Cyclobacteriaceae bacterium]|nr:phosphoribosylamine--glycine ligase [Cyclobacteriaceae bacterium]
MNILLIGSGGREHALAWKISQSKLTTKLFIAPGNAGTATIAENISVASDDLDGITEVCLKQKIDLVVVGPEVPLVLGLRDRLEKTPGLERLLMVGPGASGARLEGSKDFSKQFMLRHRIPTAKAKTFTALELEEGSKYLCTCNLPIVLKADGLAAGKGVVIAQTHDEAQSTLHDMLGNKRFGSASERVLVEEFLSGIELSVFVLTDGEHYVLLPEAKDYKRIGDGDTGPNTGGMGAVSPVPFADEAFMNKVKSAIIAPTIAGLKQESIPYRGFIFFGLINVGGSPFVIEYNARMGDPESEAVIPRIDSDLVEVLLACAQGQLKGKVIRMTNNMAVTVMMVSGGYPGTYSKGKTIRGLGQLSKSGSQIFHAGTRNAGHEVVTDGGRVIAITGLGNRIDEARNRAYRDAGDLSFDGAYFRKDIGVDLL